MISWPLQSPDPPRLDSVNIESQLKGDGMDEQAGDARFEVHGFHLALSDNTDLAHLDPDAIIVRMF